MGDIQTLIDTAVQESLAPAMALNRAILAFLNEYDELTDINGLDIETIDWPKLDYANAAYDAMFRADLFGRMEVDLERGVALESATWVDLPFQDAIDFFKAKRIMTRPEFDELSDGYKRKTFTVAHLHEEYLIENTQDAIVEAMEQGHSMKKLIKNMKMNFASWGVTSLSKHHLGTVYTTNVLGSYNHGRFQHQTDEDVFTERPFWKYMTVGDGRVRDRHRAMHGKVYPADHSIWSAWYPPNGYRCRCRVDAISVEDANNETIDDQWPDAIPDEGFAHSPDGWLG